MKATKQKLGGMKYISCEYIFITAFLWYEKIGKGSTKIRIKPPVFSCTYKGHTRECCKGDSVVDVEYLYEIRSRLIYKMRQYWYTNTKIQNSSSLNVQDSGRNRFFDSSK